MHPLAGFIHDTHKGFVDCVLILCCCMYVGSFRSRFVVPSFSWLHFNVLDDDFNVVPVQFWVFIDQTCPVLLVHCEARTKEKPRNNLVWGLNAANSDRTIKFFQVF